MKGYLSRELELRKYSVSGDGREFVVTLHGTWEGEFPPGVSEVRLEAVRGATIALGNMDQGSLPGVDALESTAISVTLKKGDEEIFAKIRFEMKQDATAAIQTSATLVRMAQEQADERNTLTATYKYQWGLPIGEDGDEEGEG